MPPHRVYIEPFLGGGNVLENKKPAEFNYGVDKDSDVVRTWLARGVGAAFAVCHGDAIQFLREFRYEGNELVYCDPPYLHSTRKRNDLYRFEMTDEQHVELLELLVTLPCMVIISGYRSKLYTDFLQHRHGWRCIEFTNTTRRGPVTECAWFNYDPPSVLHDPRYAGESFRERERIKRKRDRWRSRLAKMGDAERQVVMEALLELTPPSAAMRYRDPIAKNSDGIPSSEPAMRSRIATGDGARSYCRGCGLWPVACVC